MKCITAEPRETKKKKGRGPSTAQTRRELPATLFRFEKAVLFWLGERKAEVRVIGPLRNKWKEP